MTGGGRTVVADKGKVGFFNRRQPHGYPTIGHAEFVWVHLDGGVTEKFYRHITKLYGGSVFSHPGAEKIRDLLT